LTVSDNNSITMDLGSLPSGVYFLIIRQDQKVEALKIMKE
jgi:hypothetical protein